MIERLPHESRLQYLIRVAVSALRANAAEADIAYDGTLCDGTCLAEELENEAETVFSPPPCPGEDPWPRPWRNTHAEDGTFGSIVAANGEPVAQIMPLAVQFEPDIVKRNNWRNIMARKVAAAMNELDARDFTRRQFGVEEVYCPKCRQKLKTRRVEAGIIVECKPCDAGACGSDLFVAVGNLGKHLARR